MLRSVIAAFLLAAPAAAALGQTGQDGEWALATMPNGCMVQTVSEQGTMLSVWGFAGEEKLGFLLQNRAWSVHDGQRDDLQVEFLGDRSWPVEATARENIDADGPGFYFTVEPGGLASSGFLNSFTSAHGMRIRPDGESADTLPLAGSRGAMATLARCLSDRWGGAPVRAADEAEEDEAAPPADTI